LKRGYDMTTGEAAHNGSLPFSRLDGWGKGRLPRSTARTALDKQAHLTPDDAGWQMPTFDHDDTP